ncbi:MAG TPA: hypothetical protein VHU88_14530 [Sporichthyaceae bacterium]|nr:hypothetical protein [Sporichthyaceae bacterium]
MLRKLVFLGGVGIGYTLGARAGREHYEKIKWVAQRISPTVGGPQTTASGLPPDGEPASIIHPQSV